MHLSRTRSSRRRHSRVMWRLVVRSGRLKDSKGTSTSAGVPAALCSPGLVVNMFGSKYAT